MNLPANPDQEPDQDGGAAFTRMPPQDLDAEQSALGGMLLTVDAIHDVRGVLTAGDFYRPAHAEVFAAVCALADQGEPVDPITAAAELERRGSLARVGGAAYLFTLVSVVPTAANAAYYAEIVRRCAVRRHAIEAHTRAISDLYDGEGDLDVMVDRHESELHAAHRDARARAPYLRLSEVIEMTIDDQNKPGQRQGILTGFQDVDSLTNGFQPGELVVVGARPAAGKSTLAVDFLRAVAIQQNIPAALFSLEMGALEMGQRVLAAEARVGLHHIRGYRLTDDDWERIARRTNDLMNAPLFIDTSANLTMAEIATRARELHAREGLSLLAVDYLQLLESGSRRRGVTRQEEVSELSRRLKLLAKELEIPIIALSQLNRGPEQREDKRPQVSDLRESGGVEQDADMVILIHPQDPEGPRSGETELIFGKCRNAPTCSITVASQLHFSRFTDMAGDIPGSGTDYRNTLPRRETPHRPAQPLPTPRAGERPGAWPTGPQADAQDVSGGAPATSAPTATTEPPAPGLLPADNVDQDAAEAPDAASAQPRRTPSKSRTARTASVGADHGAFLKLPAVAKRLTREGQRDAVAERLALLDDPTIGDEDPETGKDGASRLRLWDAIEGGSDMHAAGPFGPLRYGKNAPYWTAEQPPMSGAFRSRDGITWEREHDYDDADLIRADRNASWPSAVATVRVVHSGFEHTGDLGDLAGKRPVPGYYLTRVHPWTEQGLPAPIDGKVGSDVWISGPRMQLLADLAAAGRWPDAHASDSHTGDPHHLREFGDLVNILRRYALEVHGRDSAAYAAVKRAFGMCLGMLTGAPDDNSPSARRRWQCKARRVDWVHSIKDQATVTMWRTADKILSAVPEHGPVAIRNTDELWLPREAFERVTAGSRPIVRIDELGTEYGTYGTEKKIQNGGRVIMAKSKSDTGEGDAYADHEADAVADWVEDAYDDYGDGDASYLNVRARIEWSGSVQRSHGGMRTTRLEAGSMGPVRDAVERARSIGAEGGWKSQRDRLLSSPEGVAALRANLPARTFRYVRAGRNAAPKSQARIGEAYADVFGDQDREDRRAAHREVTETLSAALREEYGVEVRFRDIRHMRFE